MDRWVVERLEVPKEEAGGRIPLSLPSLNHIHQRRTAAPLHTAPIRSTPLRARGTGVARCTVPKKVQHREVYR